MRFRPWDGQAYRCMAPIDPNDPRCRWQQDSDGVWIMPELQQQFLDWMFEFPRKGTQAEWAREHGVDERTVRRWKADPRFQKEQRLRAKEINISVERVQEVLNNLHAIASTGSGPAAVGAATRYLDYVSKLLPQERPTVTDDDDIGKLSTDELIQMAALAGDN